MNENHPLILVRTCLKYLEIVEQLLRCPDILHDPSHRLRKSLYPSGMEQNQLGPQIHDAVPELTPLLLHLSVYYGEYFEH